MTLSPPDYQAALAQCAQCGACTAVCPVYLVTGRESLTARGRLHLLARLNDPEALGELLSRCLLCGNCKRACPRGIDLVSLTISARTDRGGKGGPSALAGFLARQALARPALAAALAKAAKPLGLAAELPMDSGLRLKLSGPVSPLPALDAGQNGGLPQIRPARRLALYFPGCLATHLYPEIGPAAARLIANLDDFRLLTPADLSCCGLAAQSAGDLEQARTLARRNLARFASLDGEEAAAPIVTTCASCYAALKGYPDLLADDPGWRPEAEAFASRVWELSAFILAHGSRLAPGFREETTVRTVVYHDPCHLRPAITRQPRQLLDLVPGLRRLELPRGAQCCGRGGLFHLAHPRLSLAIRQPLIEDFLATGAELAVSSCSGCLLQWQQGLKGSPAQVTHLALLLDSQLTNTILEKDLRRHHD